MIQKKILGVILITQFLISQCWCASAMAKQAPILKPWDKSLIAVTETTNPTQEKFNWVDRNTKTAEVSGHTVVLDSLNDLNGLCKRFAFPPPLPGITPGKATDEQAALKKLTIYADTVEINGPIWLPNTELTIYSRKLRVSQNARIDTRNLPYFYNPVPFNPPVFGLPTQPGMPIPAGFQAMPQTTYGDIKLFTKVLECEDISKYLPNWNVFPSDWNKQIPIYSSLPTDLKNKNMVAAWVNVQQLPAGDWLNEKVVNGALSYADFLWRIGDLVEAKQLFQTYKDELDIAPNSTFKNDYSTRIQKAISLIAADKDAFGNHRIASVESLQPALIEIKPDDPAYLNILVNNVPNTTTNFPRFKGEFNGRPVTQLRNVLIAGNTVVLDAANDLNGLVAKFSRDDALTDANIPTNADIAGLTIHANHLIIRSKLWFPQTRVAILSKKLTFEGSGFISTKPVDSNRRGGSFLAHVHTLECVPGDNSVKRFESLVLFEPPFIGPNTLLPYMQMAPAPKPAELADAAPPAPPPGAPPTPPMGPPMPMLGGPGPQVPTVRREDPSSPFAFDGPSWNSIAVIEAMANYGRDLYKQGYYGQAMEVCAEARERLRFFSQTEMAQASFYKHLVSELDRCLFQLRANLDYFGNPPGWAPRLSFNTHLLAYKSELEADFPILYTTSIIEGIDSTLKQKKTAFQNTMDLLQNDTIKAVDSLREANTQVTNLKKDSTSLEKQLTSLKEKTKKRIDQLKQDAEEEHEPGFWDTVGSVVSTAAMICPVGQPVVAAIGAGIKIAQKVANGGKITDAVFEAGNAYAAYQGGTLATEFNKSTFTTALTDVTSAAANLQPNDLANLKTNAPILVEKANNLSKQVNEIGALFQNTQVSSAEVQQTLVEMMAKDARLKEITADLNNCIKKQEEFSTNLASALQDVTTQTERIANNTSTIAKVSNDLAEVEFKMSPALMLVASEIKNQTLDRLFKYQYYLAKSYEYRFVEAYPGSFRLNNLYNKLAEFLRSNKNLLPNNQFDAANHDTLKTAYTSDLRNLVFTRFDNMAKNGGTDKNISRTYTLSKAECASLSANPDHAIELDLAKVLFPYEQEVNRRLLKLSIVGVPRVKVAQNQEQLSTKIVSFRLEHPGVSTFQKNGHFYRFRHSADEKLNPTSTPPISWGASVDLAQDSIQEVKQSDSDRFLLDTLLGVSLIKGDLLVSPSADAKIKLRCFSNPKDLNFRVEKLVLQLDYDYEDFNGRILRIKTPDKGILPFITTADDAFANKGSAGDFDRFYSADADVQISAESKFGEYNFTNWIDDMTGADLGTANPITIKLASNMAIRPIYAVAPKQAPSAVTPPTAPVSPPAAAVTPAATPVSPPAAAVTPAATPVSPPAAAVTPPAAPVSQPSPPAPGAPH